MDADPHALAAGLRAEAGPAALALALLLTRHLRFDTADPHWPDRDRLVLADPALAAGLAARLGTSSGFAECLPAMPPRTLATALGMALAERRLAARFGRSLVDHRSWVLLEAAELLTGPAQEAAAAAGALGLGRLTLLAASGPAELAALTRLAALGWNCRRVPAEDAGAIESALSAAQRSRRPTLLALEIAGAAAVGNAPAAWPDFWQRGISARRAWLRRLHRHTARDAFEGAIAGTLTPGWQLALVPALDAGAPSPAVVVEAALGRLAAAVPEMVRRPGVGGAALAHAVNGHAMHRGVLPVAEATLEEAEAFAPALRLAAARGLRSLLLIREPEAACSVGGLRAAWRAMANVQVHRPADAAEARACLEVALRRTDGPSVLLLHDGAPGRDAGDLRAGCAAGGYLASALPGGRDLTLIASGAELAAARQAAAGLAAEGLRAAVVSLPCWELFALQPESERDRVLGRAPRFAIEAGSGFGWERWLGDEGVFIGPGADGRIAAGRVQETVRKRLPGASSRPKVPPRALASLSRLR